jgi:uncharacterized protein HemX
MRAMSTGAATAVPSPEQAHSSSRAAAKAVVKRHKLAALAGAIAALVVLGAAGVGIYSLLHRAASMPFQNLTVTQITTSGKACTHSHFP